MIGALIGAGASLIGGMLGQKSQEKQQAQNIALQKEFAKKAIQWKAADAEKAGISKLYALGANTVSYTPNSIGGSPLGEGIASAGQDIGRAMAAGQSNTSRTASLALAAAKTQLEGLQLDNDIKRVSLASKIATTNQPGTAPGINLEGTTPFIPGQGNSSILLEKKIPPSHPGAPNAEAGVNPDIAWVQTKTGWTPVIPQQLAESYENDWIGGMSWQARNRLAPIFDDSFKSDPPAYIPPGQYWQFYGGANEYRPAVGWRAQDSYRYGNFRR